MDIGVGGGIGVGLGGGVIAKMICGGSFAFRSVVPFIACVEVFLGENFDGADELDDREAVESHVRDGV